MFFMSLPLWKRKSPDDNNSDSPVKALPLLQALKIPGVSFVLITFFSYCALETTAGLWASSYLVQSRRIETGTAASFASFFYLGITFGRFLCGFVSEKIGDKRLIRYGILLAATGIVLIGLPVKASTLALIGLVLTGLGCAPVYPSIIHATPSNFGKENSQAIIGIQMASAYVGSTFMPPLFGVIADHISIGVYPFYLLFFAVLMLVMSECLSKLIVKNK